MRELIVSNWSKTMPEILSGASPEKLMILIASFITLIYCSWLIAEAYSQNANGREL